ncbi:MAG TPA: ribosome maturation factor RimP [Acidobacteriota bacterium]|jgi:ribosome maturation factor RimP|nr:ribosome maturation factor RimP [Acidobacteriota bacterium]
MSTQERLGQLLHDAVEEEGYELVHHEFLNAGEHSLLRIYVDKPGGITLDDCSQVSEKLSVLLDVEDLIPHHYTLEVSSPGLDRPLFKEQDYVRFQGRLARVKTRFAVNGQRNFKGVLHSCENGQVTLLENEKSEPVHIALDNIQKANLIFEFKN